MAQRSNTGWPSALPATTDKATWAYLLARDAIRCAKDSPGVVVARRDARPLLRPAAPPARGSGARP